MDEKTAIFHRQNTERLTAIEYTLKRQDEVLLEIKADGKETKAQVKYTNGRVTKLEKQMLIALTTMAVTIVLKFPELISLIHFL